MLSETPLEDFLLVSNSMVMGLSQYILYFIIIYTISINNLDTNRNLIIISTTATSPIYGELFLLIFIF